MASAESQIDAPDDFGWQFWCQLTYVAIRGNLGHFGSRWTAQFRYALGAFALMNFTMSQANSLTLKFDAKATYGDKL